MTEDFIFSSESVTAGHPDKLCDQISDAVVDHLLREDPAARVIAESAVAKGILFLAVRFAARGEVDFAAVARDVIARTGYVGGDFAAESCSIMTSIDAANGHDAGHGGGSGAWLDERELDDAGLDRAAAEHNVTLFGYASDETPGGLPQPLWLAHALARQIAEARADGSLPWLSPDGQAQVAVEYRDRRARRIHSLTVVAACDPETAPDVEQARRDLRERVVGAAFADEAIVPDERTLVFVNPGGPLNGGGPAAHAGLTGRKTAIDTYGEFARHSGAALSGKDPTRIDRVGAYAARHAARNVVAASLARECEIQLSYTIGQAQPVSLQVDTFGTGSVDEQEIARRLRATFDFRPAAIVAAFDLRHLPRQANGPFYERLAAYGQVGRTDLALPWEALDKVDELSGD